MERFNLDGAPADRELVTRQGLRHQLRMNSKLYMVATDGGVVALGWSTLALLAYGAATGSSAEQAGLVLLGVMVACTIVFRMLVTRTYARFSDVCIDTVNVRVYHGLHFRTADVQGEVLGKNVAEWLAAHGRQAIPLVVAHSHAHGDHIAGDAAFRDRPDTVLVGLKPADVAAFFGIKR